MSQPQYIQVVEDENDEPIEIPSELDGTLLLTTLSAQFPSACGLKYRNPDTGAFRGIRVVDGVLHPEKGNWGNHLYVAVFPKENKRKGEEGFDNPAAKTKRLESQKCSDLIVLGLPWKSTEDDLRKHFSQFGELCLVQVKKDMKTNQSKGFGFIRFNSMEAQNKCCSQRHNIDGRWCDVNIPNSREGANQQMINRKIFIGRVSEDTTQEDLRKYFNQFGEVVDVFIPKPHRAFAFVTFSSPDPVPGLCGEDHIINGTSVRISSAAPKSNYDKQDGGRGKGNYGGHIGGGGGYAPPFGGRGPGPVGGKAAGADPMAPNNIGNLLNSAMLAAAQAMLANPGPWGGMTQGAQGGAGGGDHPPPSQQGFGGGAGGGWWPGNEANPSSGSHYGGWGGSHGGRGGSGWS